MTRRGRPPGGDSAETRGRIVEAARHLFATRGFDGTYIAAVAAAAELAPSAVYHYFGGKTQLYETVFDETASTIWADIDDASHGHETLLASVQSLVTNSRGLSESHPYYNDFLAMVPMETRLHSEFSHLMDRRVKYQSRTFGALATLGLSTGELVGLSVDEATEVLRTSVMGWFFERHFRGSDIPVADDAILFVVKALVQNA
jgi:AcrR family transcriptional regulator